VDEYNYQQRKLEAAMPACTKLDRETKLKVKISLPNSPGLRAELPEVLPSGDVIMQDDVRPTNFRMRFPVETGQITLGDVCIQIKSEQFAISAIDAEPGPCQSDQYYLMVPPREDSRTLNFILQPKDTQQTGLETVYVVVYQDQDLVVATYVETQLVQTLDQNPICGNWRLQLAMVKWAAGSSALPPSHAPAPQPSEVVLERSAMESDIQPAPLPSETARKRSEMESDKRMKPVPKNKLTIWRIVGAASAVILFFVAIFGVLPDETRDGFFVSIGLIDPTAQATPTTPRITTISNLDIRDGPGTGFDRIAVLNAGDYLDILGISQDDRWYQVLLPDGNTGWVVAASSAGKVSGPIGALAVIVPTNTPTSTPTQAPTATDVPTDTPTVTDTSEPTYTPTPTPTQTDRPTSTTVPSDTPQPPTNPSDTPTPTNGVVDFECPSGLGFNMVYIPSITFLMGSDIGSSVERPIREVTVDAFCMDMFEVTNSQYQGCVLAGVCDEPTRTNSSRLSDYYNERGDFPVIWVRWEQAQQYGSLGLRVVNRCLS